MPSMNFTISASGKPAEVRDAIQKQLASARRENAAMASVGAAISDSLSSDLVGLGVDETITVSANVSVTVTGESASIKNVLEAAAVADGALLLSPTAAPAAGASTQAAPAVTRRKTDQ